MYYNLRKLKGTFKGIIGECMFKLIRKSSFLTWFTRYNEFISYNKQYISQREADFLRRFWHSIDAVEIKDNRLVIYEIKTKNYYSAYYEKRFQPEITKASYNAYMLAKKIGIRVWLVKILFFDNWKFSICYKEINRSNCFIDKEKRYDKK